VTEPVGPQYGLEPRMDHTPLRIPPNSRDLISPIPYDDPSAGEFSGVAGLIAPPPHVPGAPERLSMVYAIDPTDDGTEPESILPPELDGAFDPR
jgi:hypothetical protein